MTDSGVPSRRAWKCIICGGPIRHGEPTVFLQGDLAHQACYREPVDATDRVAGFLRDLPTLVFCNVCIAAGCSIDYAHASKATARLRLLPEFRIVVGERCAGCDNIRITFGVNPAAPDQHPISG